MEFVDRLLKCSDCNSEFVFTAGEQLFFYDKQFKNDPKRCKLCKAKRAGLGRSTVTGASVALPYSRTETRTECSACGIETTVPFKPTQGRPVLCRSCFQLKRVPSGVAAVANMDSAAAQSRLPRRRSTRPSLPALPRRRRLLQQPTALPAAVLIPRQPPWR
jgi:CxxC-x17-CxxC domain-containing protein